jgi:ribosome recycling factor
MIKKTNALGEEGMVAVRNVRRDTMMALGKLDSACKDIIKVGLPLMNTQVFR